jgi:hypothetical protein
MPSFKIKEEEEMNGDIWLLRSGRKIEKDTE